MPISARGRFQDAPDFTVPDRGYGGAGTLLFVVNVAWFFLSHRLPLAQAAMAAGLRVHLASDVEAESEILAVRQAGIEFHRLHMVRSGLNPVSELKCIRELRRIMLQVQPNIVHNVTAKPVVYGSWIARSIGVPAIVNAISGFGHVYGTAVRRPLLRGLLDRAYAGALAPLNVRVVVQNDADRDEVLRICPSAHKRVHLIRGSGVDLAIFRAIREPDGEHVVLLPARVLREKGICEFAAAAVELRRRGVAARYLLAGRLDPANRGALSAQELRDLCAASGLEWVGNCDDMPRLFRESHVVCLPSYYREGVPKALLEACACGRPIITTDTPGCRDTVDAGRSGILVPPRDVPALVAAIRQLLADPLLRGKMGAHARVLAEREFGIDQVVAKHLAIYREALSNPVAQS